MARFPPIHTIQCSTPIIINKPLALKLFRGEPAITRYDKLFTPYHKSSKGIEQPTGSGLLLVLRKIHPAHGKLIWLRVLNILH